MITYQIADRGTYTGAGSSYKKASPSGSITNLLPNTPYTLTITQSLFNDDYPDGYVCNIDTFDIKTKIGGIKIDGNITNYQNISRDTIQYKYNNLINNDIYDPKPTLNFNNRGVLTRINYFSLQHYLGGVWSLTNTKGQYQGTLYISSDIKRNTRYTVFSIANIADISEYANIDDHDYFENFSITDDIYLLFRNKLYAKNIDDLDNTKTGSDTGNIASIIYYNSTIVGQTDTDIENLGNLDENVEYGVALEESRYGRLVHTGRPDSDSVVTIDTDQAQITSTSIIVENITFYFTNVPIQNFIEITLEYPIKFSV